MAQDITNIFSVCRNIIKDIEREDENNGVVSESLLQTLKASFEKILEFQRLFLIQRADALWGTILLKIGTEIDFNVRASVDLDVKGIEPILKVNPLFCGDYTFPQFTGRVIDELLKLVYLHPATFAEKNKQKDETIHKLLELSSSASSSDILRSDIRLNGNSQTGFRMPDDIFTTTDINSLGNILAKEKEPLEYYYKVLSALKEKNNPKLEEKLGKMPSNGGKDKSQSNQQPTPRDQSSGDGKGKVATRGNGNGESAHQWEGQDADELKDNLSTIVIDAYNSLDDRQRGYVAGSVASKIKQMMEPPQISWKEVLRKMVGSIPIPYRKTKTRLNRRQPYRADLCGRLPKHTVNIVCAFDTSGSMSDRDLRYCLNEVLNIVKVYEGFEITVVECDMAIQKIYTVKKINDVQFKMNGRGGTSFLPVIDYINGEGEFKNNMKYPKAGKYKDALLVYFTDGYGDYEIPKPKTYRNLWVVMNDAKNLSLKEPYGDVKSLRADKDYEKYKNS